MSPEPIGPRGPRPTHLTDDDRLDLLNGLCSAETRERWLRHMRECEPCEARFRSMDAAAERMAALAPPPGGLAPQRRAVPRWYAAAAAAAVLVVATLLRGPGHTSGPADPVRAELRRMPVAGSPRAIRGGLSADASDELAAGLAAYDRGDDAAVVRLLERPLPPSGAERLRLVYRGSAFAHLGRYAEALDALAGVPDGAVPEPWNSEVRWTRGVSRWGSGDRAAADSTFRRFVSEAGPLAGRARSWLARPIPAASSAGSR